MEIYDDKYKLLKLSFRKCQNVVFLEQSKYVLIDKRWFLW